MAEVFVPAAATLAVPLVNLVLKELRAKADRPTASLDDMHTALNDGLESLFALQSDRDRKVDLSNIHKDPSNVYVLWKKRLSNIEKHVTSLNKDYRVVGKGYFNSKRKELRVEIKRALHDLIELVEGCPEDILLDKLLERAIKEADKSIAKYRTLQNAFDNILTLLKRKGVKCVALHGEKGVGKTTIMQHLNNHFYESIDEEFDMVIFIKVPVEEQKDLHILQKIADRIKVDRDGDELEVAGRIKMVLKNKRYLLILDGVRHAVDVIWENLDIPNDKRDSRVVIATQYPLAWKSDCVDMTVKLEPLSETEAWMMFRDIVGDKHLLHIPTAKQICKRFCSRLPILIDPIARSFKHEERIDWQWALKELTPWPQVEADGLEQLYSHLETCYQLLRDQRKQKCFLYASLHPANSEIYTDYLVECCIALGVFDNVDADTKYSGMRSPAIDTILRHLVNIAFLEEGEQMRYVKMNDLYRQLALYISSNASDLESRIYVDNEEHEKRPFRSESCQDARWVSMVGSKRSHLPTNLCKSLQTLLLQKNPCLVEIPHSYFDSMGNLLVLNLYGTKIIKLPSLKGLIGLKAFYLNGCSELKIFSHDAIKPLLNLEVLDIRDTGVNFVPCLKSLRCLRISYIASGNYHEISELHNLEELTFEVESIVEWCNDAKNIIPEIASLENLTTFRCNFPSSEILGKFLDTRKSWRGKKQFTSFHFFVGCENSKHPKIIESFKDRISKYIKYCNGDKKDDLAITEMLSQAEAFELICHNNVVHFWELVKASNLEDLRVLLIEGCNQMLTIVAGDTACNAISGTSSENASLLPSLDQLHLDNLRDLWCVFKGPFPPGSFFMLHTLTLKNCPGLTSIFSETAVDDFPELQELVVRNCSKIEVLIEGQSILPKLKMLMLDDLSNLKSVCRNKDLEWGFLEQLHVQKCPELKDLPFNTTNATYLRTIKGEKDWWSNLEWIDDEVHKRFESAFSAST